MMLVQCLTFHQATKEVSSVSGEVIWSLRGDATSICPITGQPSLAPISVTRIMQQWNLTSKIFLCALLFQAAPAQAPKTLLDNDRVVVRDITGPDPAEPLDSVVVSLSGAESGTAVFLAKGATPDISGRYIVVVLKDHANVPVANTSGYPLAFPRPGAKKILENEKVIVWDNTWAPGVAAPMHFTIKTP